jgi:hypothetical protein
VAIHRRLDLGDLGRSEWLAQIKISDFCDEMGVYLGDLHGLPFKKDLLFVNKKKQKNFSSIGFGVEVPPRSKRMKVFLILFFKKEHAYFLSA